MKYKACKKIDKSSGVPKAKYYAASVSKGIVGTKELAEEISRSCSLTQADIYAAIASLQRLIEKKLHEGYKVELEDIGIFSLSATSPGFDVPEACTPGKVKAGKICFLASKKLKKGLQFVTFEKEKTRSKEPAGKA